MHSKFIIICFLSFFSFALRAQQERPCTSIELEIIQPSLVTNLNEIANLNAYKHRTEEISINLSLTDFLQASNTNQLNLPIHTNNTSVEYRIGRALSQEQDKQNQALKDSFTKIAIIVRSRDELAHDKFLHFAVGAGISEVTRHSIRGLLPNGAEGDRLAGIIAFGVTTAIGVAKELRDRQGHGTPELADALWTSAGSGLTLLRFNYRF